MTTPLPEPHTDAVPVRPNRARRYTIVGLSAGLLGGAAVGLVGTSPFSSQAAELPQLVAVADDTTDTTDTTGTDDADVEVPAPGTWLTDALQPLVDDGTLTTDQRDAVVAALEDARPMFPGHDGRGPRMGDRGHLRFDREEIAAVLGLDLDALADALRAGTSLADLAEQQGIDIEVVVDLLVADVEERLADRVEDGALTEEQAADRAAEVRERITDFVERERLRD